MGVDSMQDKVVLIPSYMPAAFAYLKNRFTYQYKKKKREIGGITLHAF